MTKDHGPSIKNDEVYESLREDGAVEGEGGADCQCEGE
jgi:hypothetical protein